MDNGNSGHHPCKVWVLVAVGVPLKVVVPPLAYNWQMNRKQTAFTHGSKQALVVAHRHGRVNSTLVASTCSPSVFAQSLKTIMF